MRFKQLLLSTIMGLFFIGLTWAGMGCKETKLTGHTKVLLQTSDGEVKGVY